MSYNRILITGINGYIAKIFDNVLLNTEHVVTTTSLRGAELEQLIWNTNPDILIHCGMPSSNELYTDEQLRLGISSQAERLANICRNKRIYLIFTSSHVVDEDNLIIDNVYKQCHIEAIREISKIGSSGALKYTIIKFPRVYSSEREKGLIDSLRRRNVPESDMNKWLSYNDKEDVEDWLGDFFESFRLDNMIFNHCIQKIPNTCCNTIEEIKERYIDNV